MRLQTRLMAGFATVTLAATVILGIGASVLVARQYRHVFSAKLDAAEAEVDREVRRVADEVVQSTVGLGRADDPTLGPLLVELARGPDGVDDGGVGRELAARMEAQMHAFGFDVLEIVDARGVVLAAGHFPGRVGDPDPAALERARAWDGQPRLVEDRLVERGRVQPVLAVEVARRVRATFADGSQPSVVLIGGRRLGRAFLERLPFGARLLGADGHVLESRAAPTGAPRRLVELRGADGRPAARVELVVPDDELRRALRTIGWSTLALGLGGVAAGLVVGAWLARRITRPLEALAVGARAVARGQLDTTVEVPGDDELGELGRAFNAMTRDLGAARADLVRAERVAAWREIAQRIAHEIKNPLTPIQMAIETLQRARARQSADFDALFGESSKTIVDEVGRLKHIVAEFSSFARMPAPRLAPLDVGEVVQAALALYAGAVPVERVLASGLPPALADRDQLVQVLLNLVENARDAVEPRGGRITVRTRAVDGRVELEVADDGPGLSDEARAKLFTPYFTTKARGTGLGLAIVHRIVTDHGGEIRVGDGAPGAVFTVALPAVSR
jgi:signal transduction histidine kinase